MNKDFIIFFLFATTKIFAMESDSLGSTNHKRECGKKISSQRHHRSNHPLFDSFKSTYSLSDEALYLCHYFSSLADAINKQTDDKMDVPLTEDDNAVFFITLLKQAAYLLASGTSVRDAIITLAQSLQNSSDDQIITFFNDVIYFDCPLLFNACAKAVLLYPPQKTLALAKRLFPSLNNVDQFDGKNPQYLSLMKRVKLLENNFSDKPSLTDLVEMGLETIEEGTLSYMEQIERATSITQQAFGFMESIYSSNRGTSFEETYFMKKALTYPQQRPYLIAMVNWLQTMLDFTPHNQKLLAFFKAQPEGFIKMAIRFLYADANTGVLLDNVNINQIRNSFKSDKNSIDLRNCFLNDAKLSSQLMTFIQLAGPLYRNNDKNLRLDDNKLIELPKKFGTLTQLQQIDLTNNQLATLPTELANLTELKYLYIGCNKLTRFPEELCNLVQLQLLSLISNKVTELPAELGKLALLRNLYLTDNNLTTLPLELDTLAHLQELHINKNQLTILPDWITHPRSGLTTNYAENPLTPTDS